MLPLDMKIQADTITAYLARYGWHIVEREHPFESEWWALEFWLIESAWSPKGLRLYLTFGLVGDPPDFFRELSASRDRPIPPTIGRTLANMSLMRGWEAELADFTEAICKSRNDSQR